MFIFDVSLSQMLTQVLRSDPFIFPNWNFIMSNIVNIKNSDTTGKGKKYKGENKISHDPLGD